MNLDWLKTQNAWQPFTFRGCARFAGASIKRLLVWQLVVALLSASGAVWFLNDIWFPVVDQAATSLPESGEIRGGRLFLEEPAPRILAESRSLAFILDPEHSGTMRGPAHIQVEAGTGEIRIISLFGYFDWPYTTQPSPIQFNKVALVPWWGAWRAPLLWMTFGGVFIGLLLVWWFLATLYFLPVWLLAFFSSRKLKVLGSWKLCGAALLPGACLILMGAVLYSTGFIGVVELLAIQGAHWICGWVYCCGGAAACSMADPDSTVPNPFVEETEAEESKKDGRKPGNPFQSPG